jgi:hypothetical protein
MDGNVGSIRVVGGRKKIGMMRSFKMKLLILTTYFDPKISFTLNHVYMLYMSTLVGCLINLNRPFKSKGWW